MRDPMTTPKLSNLQEIHQTTIVEENEPIRQSAEKTRSIGRLQSKTGQKVAKQQKYINQNVIQQLKLENMQSSMSLNKTNNSAQMAEKQAQRRTYFKGGETRNGLVDTHSQMS